VYIYIYIYILKLANYITV